MQEREQAIVRLVFDAQIVEAVSAGQRAAVKQAGGAGTPRAQQRGAALAEQIAVVQFVNRVGEIQTAQQRIGRAFGGAEDVAAAVGFDFGKGEQLAHPPVEVAPDPAVHRPQHAIEWSGSS